MRYLLWTVLALAFIPIFFHPARAQEKEVINLTLQLDPYNLYSALADAGMNGQPDKSYSESGYPTAPIVEETPKSGSRWLKEMLWIKFPENIYLLPTLRFQTTTEKRSRVRCPVRNFFRICTMTISFVAGDAMVVINRSSDTRSVNFGIAGGRGISITRSRKLDETVTTLRVSRKLGGNLFPYFPSNQNIIGVRVRITF